MKKKTRPEKCCKCNKESRVIIAEGKPDAGKHYCLKHYDERPEEDDEIKKGN